MSDIIDNRYEFVLFFTVENGNPNGDPDAGNMPRIDPQTGLGIVSDVCLKRKVRNYVQMVHEGAFGHDIYVTEGVALNQKQCEAYEACGITKKDDKDGKMLAKDYMCRRFYDIRTFGAVMDTGDCKCGQVRGPVQFCFARSQDVIFPQNITITRMAPTSEREEASRNRTMGSKYIVPFALYRMEGFISAKLAQQTGFSQDDLTLLWESLINMFEHDRSAARGMMAVRDLLVFRHDSALGNAPAHRLFSAVEARKKEPGKPPRSFDDYEVTIDREAIPGTVKLEALL